MAELIVNRKRLIKNISHLNKYLNKHSIEWTLITKVLSGHKSVLKSILYDDEIKKVHSIGDSRLSSLKTIKQIRPDIVTFYIKPPAISYVKSVVSYADISINTSYQTIKALDEEAKKQNKNHRIIIMVELGELREGVMRQSLVKFYEKLFKLKNIKVIGLGANLGCMYGIEPTFDKLIQLCLYEQIIESKFDKKLEIISGGSSITLPLIGRKKIPNAVNHFRIGEAAFLGTSPLSNKRFKNLSTNAFEYKANIIEMAEKSRKPEGKISEANVGHTGGKLKGKSKFSYRALVDFGILDVDYKELKPKDENVNFFGTTSDLTVYDLGANITKSEKIKYKVGNKISFKPNYMAVARLMSSKFIKKIIF